MPKELSNAILFECRENGPCASIVSFTVPADAVSAEFEKAAKDAVKYARIPGFRPGKAPVSMVKVRYKDAISEESERSFQRAGFEKLGEKENSGLDIVAFGRMNAEKKPEPGAEYKFTLEVETAPAVNLPDFKSFKIEKPEVDDIEKRVADRLQYLKQLYAEYKPVEGEITDGDMLKVSYESDFVLPENASPALAHAVKAEEAWLHITEPEQIPGMNKALTGGVKGGEYAFAAVYPADWRQEELRGKTVNYKVKVHDGQRKVQMTDDEELARKTGAANVEDMMKNIRKTAEYERDNEIRAKVKDEMQKQVLEKTPEFSIPAGMLSSVTQREFSNIVNRMVRSEADVEAFRKDQDKHLEEAKRSAADYLRRFFILRAAAKQNNITVSREEIDRQIQLMCMYTGRKEEEVRKTLEQSGREAEIEEDILMSKTLDLMIEGICGKAADQAS